MNLGDLKGVVILIGLIALIGGATGIALDSFKADQYTSDPTAGCNATTNVNCSYAHNITSNGLTGVDNTTSYLDTIGTIAGVSVLIGVVAAAFSFARR